MSEEKPNIYKRLAKVRELLPAIGKNHKNTGQGWMFRGVDDVQNVLGAALAGAGVVMLPSYEIIQATPNEGGKGYTVFLKAKYMFVGEEGDVASATFVGQGTDPGDKAVGKAKAVCFKYMAFQTFQIPLEPGILEDNDRDSPEARPKSKPATATNDRWK